MDAAQNAQVKVPLQNNITQYNLPPQCTKNQEFFTYNIISKTEVLKNPYPTFESVLHVDVNKKVYNPDKNPLNLIRKSFLFFLTNVIYTIAIVSLNFLPGYNENFISHDKIFYFILFFSILSITLIFVFGISIRDCSRTYPFNIVLFIQMAIAIGFLLTLIKNPTNVIVFLSNVIILIIAFNAVLHFKRQIDFQAIFYTLTILNILFLSLIMIITFDITTYSIMIVCTEILVIYISLFFFPLVKFLNLLDREDYIFLSIFIYLGFPLVILRWLSCFISYTCGCCFRGTSLYFCMRFNTGLACLSFENSCSSCSSESCTCCSSCSNLTSCFDCCSSCSCACCSLIDCSGDCLGNGEEIGKVCCCCCILLGEILK